MLALFVLVLGASTISIPVYKLAGWFEYQRHERLLRDILELKTQLNLYMRIAGTYPTTQQGLQALVGRPKIDPMPSKWQPLLNKLPKDPWQNNYVYRSPGIKHPESYDLFSAGPDRIPDTIDDDWGD